MNILKRIKQTGWRYSFEIAFNRIVPPSLFRCRKFVVLQLLDRPPRSQNPHVSVSWCETESQVRAVEQLTYFQRSYSSGQLVACQATIDGQLAGGFWSATEQFDESELGIRYLLAPRQAWLFAALVNHQFRRQGVYCEILNFIIHELKEENHQHQLVAVNPHNLGSYRVHLEHSFRSPGSIFALRALNIAVCFAFGEIECSRRISFNARKNPIQIRIPSIDSP